MADHHDHDGPGHDEHGHEHDLVEVTLLLEDEHLDGLDQVAAEISEQLGQEWDRGAVVRLAVSQFLSSRGIV